MKQILTNRTIKFILTGGIAFVVEFCAFIVLVYILKFNLISANIISFSTGLITSFTLNKAWVFNNREKSKKQFVLYIILALFNLFISTLIINMLSTTIKPAATKVMTVIVIAIWNYFIYKTIIFSSKQ